MHSGTKHHDRPFRAFFRRHRTLNGVYRTGIAVIGGVIVVAGIMLIPLPGPGWLIVFAGLGVLATEFAWAGRLLTYARDKVLAWTAWVTRQPLWGRMLIGLAGVALLAGLALAYLGLYGVPEWLPIL